MALSVEYDDATCRRVADWLRQEFPDIGDRYAPADVAEKVRGSLHGVSTEGAERAIDDVVAQLMGCEETVLVAVLRTGRLETSWRTAEVWVGPNSEVDRLHGVSLEPADGFPDDAFTVVVTDAGQGVVGLSRALTSLERVVGAVHVMYRMHTGAAPEGVGIAETLNSTVLARTLGAPDLVPLRIGRQKAAVPRVDLDHVLREREFLEDCVGSSGRDLVASRLRSAAPWFQTGFEASEYSEAVLALGIALETLVGTDRTVDAVRTVAMRCAYLLRTGEGEERSASALRVATRAKDFYGQRSLVAHGRFDGAGIWDPKRESALGEFEAFVCDVVGRFRQVGRSEGWASDGDLTNWQARLEMA